MRRRLDAPGGYDVWPAFTDALSGLVVVLVFLITVFVIGETLLSREVSGKNVAIDALEASVARLEALVGSAEQRARGLEERVGELEEGIAERDLVTADLRAELGAAEAQRLRLAADLERTRRELEASRAGREREAAAAGERTQGLQAALAQAQAERQRETSAAAAQVEALGARAERLAADVERLERALALRGDELAQARAAGADAERRAQGLQATLDEQAVELAARAARIDAQTEELATRATRIEALDRQIKARLVERVEELERYRSDFFGRLRALFEGNPDIKVVGDRFVFQSEVLFGSGEAALSDSGKTDLDKFVAVYRQLAANLPADLPVIIEVQGHTDRVPIRVARFRSNWELSSARAQDVVDYLIRQGVPPERLAAVGMGEHHPIEAGDTPEALRRNRRIELKITSR